MRLADVVGNANAESPSTTGIAGVRCWGVIISPIVDDEGCDFLCSERQTLAELIETVVHRQGMAGGDTRGRWAQLLTFHVD